MGRESYGHGSHSLIPPKGMAPTRGLGGNPVRPRRAPGFADCRNKLQEDLYGPDNYKEIRLL